MATIKCRRCGSTSWRSKRRYAFGRPYYVYVCAGCGYVRGPARLIMCKKAAK